MRTCLRVHVAGPEENAHRDEHQLVRLAPVHFTDLRRDVVLCAWGQVTCRLLGCIARAYVRMPMAEGGRMR